jgi:hypothetical protein
VKNPRLRILLGLAGVAALALLVVVVWKKKAHQSAPPSASAVTFRVYRVDEWLDSCLTGCRRSAPRRLSHLSPEKRERYCTVNCECGMEKMTEPGPASRTVVAPSKYWLSLGEEAQMKAANDCQQRTTAQVGP